jgi:hypothetical protein
MQPSAELSTSDPQEDLSSSTERFAGISDQRQTRVAPADVDRRFNLRQLLQPPRGRRTPTRCHLIGQLGCSGHDANEPTAGEERRG